MALLEDEMQLLHSQLLGWKCMCADTLKCKVGLLVGGSWLGTENDRYLLLSCLLWETLYIGEYCPQDQCEHLTAILMDTGGKSLLSALPASQQSANLPRHPSTHE